MEKQNSNSGSGVHFGSGTLPDNWAETRDPETGKTYYWNMVTHETRWDRPDGRDHHGRRKWIGPQTRDDPLFTAYQQQQKLEIDAAAMSMAGILGRVNEGRAPPPNTWQMDNVLEKELKYTASKSRNMFSPESKAFGIFTDKCSICTKDQLLAAIYSQHQKRAGQSYLRRLAHKVVGR
jgi:hypothetical protein